MANEAAGETQVDNLAVWFITTYTQLPLDGKAHRDLVSRLSTITAERDRLRGALAQVVCDLGGELILPDDFMQARLSWDDGLTLYALREGGE